MVRRKACPSPYHCNVKSVSSACRPCQRFKLRLYLCTSVPLQVPPPATQPPGTRMDSYRIRAAVSKEAEGSWGDVLRWSSCQLGSYKRLQEEVGDAAGAGSSCPCYTGRVRLVLQYKSDGGGATREQVGCGPGMG